jgi:predicted small integral membrane protein
VNTVETVNAVHTLNESQTSPRISCLPQLLVGIGLAGVSPFATWLNNDTTPDRARLIACGLAIVPAAFAICMRRTWPFVCAGFLASIAVLMSLGDDAPRNLARLVTGNDVAVVGPVVLLCGAIVIAWSCFSEATNTATGTATNNAKVRVAETVAGVTVAALLAGAIYWRDSTRPEVEGRRRGERASAFQIERLPIENGTDRYVSSAWIAASDDVRSFWAGDRIAFFAERSTEAGDFNRRLVARDVSGKLLWQRSTEIVLVSDSGVPMIRPAGDSVLEILDPLSGKKRFSIPAPERIVTVGPWIVTAGGDQLGFYRVEDGKKVSSVPADCGPEQALGGDVFVFVICSDGSALAVEVADGNVTFRVNETRAFPFTSAGPAHVRRVGDGKEPSQLFDLATGTSSPTQEWMYLPDSLNASVLWRVETGQSDRFDATAVDAITLQPTGVKAQIALDPRDENPDSVAISGNLLVVVPDNGVGTELSPAGERRRGIALYNLTTGERLGEIASPTVVARPDFILLTNWIQRSANTVVVHFDGVVEGGPESYLGVFQLNTAAT